MTAKTASNAALITFPRATGGTEIATHFGIGTSPTGAGKMLYIKALDSTLAISNNIQPQYAIGALTVTVAGGVSDSWNNDALGHVFLNSAITLIGDAAGLLGSTVAGNLYISLHTADPGAAGTQATSECAYPPYARVAASRTAGGWTVA